MPDAISDNVQALGILLGVFCAKRHIYTHTHIAYLFYGVSFPLFSLFLLGLADYSPDCAHSDLAKLFQ